MLAFTFIKQGANHAFQHKSCEDSAAYSSRRGASAVCLCDGAGSYSFTKEGSQTLSRRMAAFATEHFEKLYAMSEAEMKISVLHVIRRTLAALHMRYAGADDESFASTMLLGALASGGRYLTIQLGDGLVSDGFKALTRPQKGESGHATYLTTSSDFEILSQIAIDRGLGVDAILLTSDGTENLLFNNERVSGTVAEMLGIFRENPGNIESEVSDIAKQLCRMSKDDISFAMLTRGFPGLPPDVEKYARSREAGASICKASRQAGWGRRGYLRKKHVLLENHIV